MKNVSQKRYTGTDRGVIRRKDSDPPQAMASPNVIPLSGKSPCHPGESFSAFTSLPSFNNSQRLNRLLLELRNANKVVIRILPLVLFIPLPPPQHSSGLCTRLKPIVRFWNNFSNHQCTSFSVWTRCRREDILFKYTFIVTSAYPHGTVGTAVRGNWNCMHDQRNRSEFNL